MKRAIFAIVAALCFVAFAHADEEVHDDDVVVLSAENFDELTDQGTWLLEFYAPWCAHCKQLAPIYGRAATKLRDRPIKLAKIDCTYHGTLCSRFQIKSYPTLKIYRDGVMRDYRDDRTYEALVRFGRMMTKPAVLPTNLETIWGPLDEFPVNFVYFGPANAPEYKTFEKVARSYQGRGASFLRAETDAEERVYRANQVAKAQKQGNSPPQNTPDQSKYKSLFEKYKVDVEKDGPTVIWLTEYLKPERLSKQSRPSASDSKRAADSDNSAQGNNDDDDDEFGRWSESDLRAFVEPRFLPLISEMGPGNFEELTNSGKLVVFSVTDPKGPKTERFKSMMVKIAEQFRVNFAFGNMDGIKYSKYVSQFGIEPSSLPTVFVFDYPNERYYAHDDIILNNREEIEEFLENVMAGKVQSKGQVAWYHPGKLYQRAERWLAGFSETELLYFVGFVMIAFFLLLAAACWYTIGDSGDAPAQADEKKND